MCSSGSLGKLGDLLGDSLDTGVERHVHEFRLSVHLETSENGTIDLVLNSEFFSFVSGVGFKGREDLVSLGAGKLSSRDNCDFLLLVELSVQLLELLSNLLNEHKSLVLSKNSQEVDSGIGEGSSLEESLVEQFDFLLANTSVLGELTELLGVNIQLAEVGHVLVDVVESASLGGSGEENGSVSALDGVFLAGGSVVGGRVELLDVSKREGLEKRSVQVEGRSGSSSTGGSGLLGGSLNGSGFLNSGLDNGLSGSLFDVRRLLSGLLGLLGESTGGNRHGGVGSSGGARNKEHVETTSVEALQVVGNHICFY